LYSQKKLIFFLNSYEKSKSQKTRAIVNNQIMMNCYTGLAKRIAKSCFPPVIPVPQLEPLDARLIIKQEVKDTNTNKACFALSDAHERLFKPISFKPISFKPISDEEAWAATLAWAEAKAQERETKATSQTDTDESYESDDSDDFADMASPPLLAMAGLMRVGAVTTKVYSLNDAAAAAATWRDDAQANAYECVAAKKALEALDKQFPSAAQKYTAATIIQAAARGMSVRAWKAQFIYRLAIELPDIYRARYLSRSAGKIDFVEQHLAEQWDASPNYARVWIKLAEQRRHSNQFWHMHHKH
jgi:hypothetical protein